MSPRLGLFNMFSVFKFIMKTVITQDFPTYVLGCFSCQLSLNSTLSYDNI